MIIARTWASAASRRSMTPSVSSVTKVSDVSSMALLSTSSSTALEISVLNTSTFAEKLSSRCFCTRSQSTLSVML